MSDEVISIIDVKLIIHSNEEWWMGSMLEPGKINFVHFYFEIPLRLLNGKVKKKKWNKIYRSGAQNTER